MKRLSIALMLLAAFGLLLTQSACGEDEAPADPEPTTEPDPEPDEEPDEEPVEEPDEPEPTAERTDQTELDCDAEGAGCAMWDWMLENVDAQMQDRDFAALKTALHTIEHMSPDPEWNTGAEGWAQIARRGALAAEAEDFEGVQNSCRGCHGGPGEADSFRARYRSGGFRTDPLDLPDNAAEGIADLDMGE